MSDELEAEIEKLIKEAWQCSLTNGFDGIHEDPDIEIYNLADQDVDIEKWVWAEGEAGYDDRLALLLKVVTRLQKEDASQ